MSQRHCGRDGGKDTGHKAVAGVGYGFCLFVCFDLLKRLPYVRSEETLFPG